MFTRKTKTELALLTFIVAALFIGTFMYSDQIGITGFSVGPETIKETLDINTSFVNNSVIDFSKEDVTTITITGNYEGNGTAIIYANVSGTLLKIYETRQNQNKNQNLITGYVVYGENETENITEEIIIEEPPVEVIPEAVNETINETIEEPTIKIVENETTNETINEINNSINSTLNETIEEIINETLNISINETINLTENITLNNTENITEEILPPEDQIIENISINETETNTTINETIELEILANEFTNACMETCSLLPITISNIIIEIKEGTLYVENIDYSRQVATEVVQIQNFTNITISNETTIDLSQYFLGENIYFDATGAKGYNYNIQESMITLIPVEQGTWPITVYAAKGSTVLSQEFYITIINQTNNLSKIENTLLEKLQNGETIRVIAKTKDKIKTITIQKPKQNEKIDIGKQDTNIKEKYDLTNEEIDLLEGKKILDKETKKAIKIEQETDKTISTTSNLEQVLELANLEEVEQIIIDEPFSTLTQETISITKINLVQLLNYTGKGQTICVLDTGVSNIALGTNITGFNVLNNSVNVNDEHGHGTQVTYALIKTAPDANIIAVKVMDESGNGYASDIIAGLEYCEQQNANIISMSIGGGSFGGYCEEDIVAQKVNELNNNGILVVAATGNDGSNNNIKSPACASGALAVSSSTKSKTIAYFSNYNNATLLVAPGENIQTITNTGTQTTASGTSISIPFVSGSAALILENETLNSSELKDLLIHTGDLINNSGRQFSQLNTWNALNKNITNNLSVGDLLLINNTVENYTILGSNPLNMYLMTTYQDNAGACSIDGARGMQYDSRGFLIVSAYTDDYITVLNISNPLNISCVGSIYDAAGPGSVDGIWFGSLDDTNKYFYTASTVDDIISIYNITTSNPILLNGTAVAVSANTAPNTGSLDNGYTNQYIDVAGTRYCLISAAADNTLSVYLCNSTTAVPTSVFYRNNTAPPCSTNNIRNVKVVPGTNKIIAASYGSSAINILTVENDGILTCVSNITDTAGANSIHSVQDFYFEEDTKLIYATSPNDGYLTIINATLPIAGTGQLSFVGSVGNVSGQPDAGAAATLGPTTVTLATMGSTKYAFVGSTNLTFQKIDIYNVTNPASPVRHSIFDLTSGSCIGNATYSLYVDGNYLYATSAGDACFYVIQLSIPNGFPNYTYFNGSTTNFRSYNTTQLENFSNVIIESPSHGMIKWNNPINVSNANFDNNINMASGFIYVNSSGLDQSLNSSANITFYNAGGANLKILKDGQPCTTCTFVSYSNGNLTYTITGFSNYSLTMNVTLTSPSGSATSPVSFISNIADVTRIINATLYTNESGTFAPRETRWNGEIAYNSTDLVALWHFNNETTLGENDTYIRDWSGNNINLSCSNTCPPYASGKFGLGQYKQPDDTDFSYPDDDNFTGWNTMTVMVWVNPLRNQSDQGGQGGDIVSKRHDGTGGMYNMFYLNVDTNNNVNFYIANATDETNAFGSNNSTLAGRWTMILGRYNGTHADVFVNGVKNNTAEYTFTGTLLDSNADLFIGFTDFNGSIDEVAIWNRSLSDAEILSLYNYTKTNFEPVFQNKTLTVGTYTWNVQAYDNNSDYAWATSNYSFTIIPGETAPTVTLINPANSATTTSPVLFISNITNNQEVINASLYTNETGSWTPKETRWNGEINYNDTGLIGLWHLNNESAFGENTTYFKDWSGNGNNGVCAGTWCPVYNSSGKFGSTYTFGGVNDTINISNTALLNSTGNLTISAWVKYTQSWGWLAVVTKDSGALSYWFGTNGGAIDMIISDDGVHSGYSETTGTTTLESDIWYHLVATYNGSQIRLYVNGQLDNTPHSHTTGIFSSSSYITIGDSPAWDNNEWPGSIDEVAIWNRSLSATEILEIYNYSKTKFYPTFQNSPYNYSTSTTWNILGADNISNYSWAASNYTFNIAPAPFECGNLNTANTIYNLTQNISISGATCFDVQAENITLDCAGYSITGNNSDSTYGVYSEYQINTTVKNCHISNFSRGVFFNNGATDGTIYNNTINISMIGQGIYLNSEAHRHNISANTIYMTDGWGITVHGDNVTVDCQNKNMIGGGTRAGIDSDAYNLTIKNCNLSNFGDGVYLSTTTNTKILDSTIAAPGNAIYLQPGHYTTINNITITGGSVGGGDGINVRGSNNSIISNVKISRNDWYGIYTRNSHNVIYNNISINMTGNAQSSLALTTDGVATSSNNTFNNLTINTDASSHEAIYVYGPNNNFNRVSVTHSNGNYAFEIIDGENTSIDCQGGIIAGSNNSNTQGIYSTAYNNSVKNCIFRDWNNSIRLIGSNNGQFINNTFIPMTAGTQVYIDASSSNNIFVLNNFTATSGNYVTDLNGSNIYNETYAGLNQGNVWANVISGAVIITGNETSSKPPLYIGIAGSGYPYNYSTSSNKFDCNFATCADYAPLTTTNENAPVINIANLNSSTIGNYTTDNLLLYFTQTGTGTVFNATDFRKNGTSITLLNMPFNTNVSSNYTDAVGDISTYENNGTLGGGNALRMPTWTSNGKVGGAYDFDGDVTQIVAPLVSYDKNITMTLWIKSTENMDVYAPLVEQGGSNAFRLIYMASSNLMCFGNDTVVDNFYCGTVNLQSDTWHLVVAGFNGSNYILINTTPVSLSQSPGSYGPVGASNLYVGYRDYTGIVSAFNGTIDEVQIFNRSLSQEQIQAIYQAGLNNQSLATIVNQETVIGDNWSACVTPSSGSVEGETVCSNNLIINELECGNLTNANNIYTLSKNVSIAGDTCFNIQEANITLDCAGHSITGNNSENTNGVYAYNYPNATVKNCYISNFSKGIFYNWYVYNSLIYNNTINISYTDGTGIHLQYYSDNTKILSNNIYVADGVGTYVNADIANITIDCQGKNISGGGTSYGLLTSSSHNTTIKNCNINNFYYDVYAYSDALNVNIFDSNFESGTGYGLAFDNAHNGIINNLTSKGYYTNVYLQTSNNITISNLNLPLDNNGGLVLYQSHNNTLTNITGNASSAAASTIQVTDGSYNNTFNNVNINTSAGDWPAILISGTDSHTNTFNNVNINHSGTHSAVRVESGENNTIDCQGGSIIGSNYSGTNGIYSTQYNTTVKNCNISNFGNGIYFDGVRYGNIQNTESDTTNSGSYGIYLYSTNFTKINSSWASSNTGMGLYLSEESNFNTIINSNSSSNTNEGTELAFSNYNTFNNNYFKSNGNGRGIYIGNSLNNYFSNSTFESTTYKAVELADSNNNILVNNTLITSGGSADLSYIWPASANNTFILNNFTDTSGLYVFDENGTNYYNGTFDSLNQGNIWHNVINKSVIITGTTASSIWGLNVGDGGTDYPYNTANSQGKLSGTITDYAPLIIDDKNPETTLISPANNANSTNNTWTFKANATDDINIINASLYTNETGSWTPKETRWNGEIKYNSTGLIALWHFNNESAFGENDTLARDLVGEHNATPYNVNWYPNIGRFGGAYNLTLSDDFINASQDIDFRRNFTLSFWAYRTIHSDSSDSLFYKENEFWIGWDSNDNTTIIQQPDYPWDTIYGGSALSNNVWYNYVVVHNNETNEWVMYVNGDIYISGTMTMVGPADGDMAFGGQDVGYISNPFGGVIDEIAIWNRSLSTTEILEIYNYSKTKFEPTFQPRTLNKGNYIWNVLSEDDNSQTDWGDSNFTLTISAVTTLTPTINPTTAYTNDTLYGYCNGSLADSEAGGNIGYFYKWFLNGAINKTGSTSEVHTEKIAAQVTNISNDTTVKTQTWILSCLAFTGLNNGIWMNSTGLTITNSPPTQPNTPTANPSYVYRNDTITSTTGTGSTDADDDSITYYYRWINSSTTFQENTSNTFKCSTNTNCKKDMNITVAIRGYDNSNYGLRSSESNIVQIQNYPPSTPTLLTPASGNYGTTVPLNCSNSTDVVDNDTIYYNLQSNRTGAWTNIILTDANGYYDWSVDGIEENNVLVRCQGDDLDNVSNYLTSSGVFNVDALPPRLAGNYSNHTTKYGDDVSFNVTWNDVNLDYCIFEYYNGSTWINTTNNSCANGQTWTVVKTMTATRGKIINWTWYANDTYGNQNKSGYDNYTIQNTAPNVSSVILNATSSENLTSDNLTLYYSEADADADIVSNVADWRINGTSIAVLNMPFNTNVSNNNTGSVNDYTTFGNNGTLGGGTSANIPTWNSSGKVGGAYSFDGNNDVIIVDRSDSIEPESNITIDAWVNIRSGNTPEIVRKQHNSGSGYDLRFEGTRLVRCWINAQGTWDNALSSSSTPLNSWEHISCTYDGTTIKIYRNGIINATKTHSAGGAINYDGSPLYIGCDHTCTNFKMNGLIDELHIFNRSLSQEQINEIYQAGYNNHSLNTILTSETSNNQNWSACVTPSDGYDDGTTVCSTNLTTQEETQGCGSLTSANTIYNLTNNVSIDGATCFTVEAANIVLDCGGFSITGNNTTSTYGITSNQFNTTVNNCLINNFSTGVYFADADNGTIINTYASTTQPYSGSNGAGIYLFGNAYDNKIINSTGNATSGNGVVLYWAYNTLLANSTGISNSGEGIYLTSAESNTLNNFTGISNSGRGIILYISGYNAIVNSNATSNNIGIWLESSNNNTISNTKTQGTHSSYGAALIYQSNNNIVANSSIYAGSSSLGIQIQTNSNNNQIINTSIINSSSAMSSAIYISGGVNNSVDCKEANIRGTNSTSTYGIYSDQHNTTVKNCNISKFEYGIFYQGANNSHILDSQIHSVMGSGIYLYSSNYTTISNVTSRGDGGANAGIYVRDTIGAAISFVNVSGYDGYGLLLQDADSGNYWNVTSTPASTDQPAIQLYQNSTDNTFTNISIVSNESNRETIRLTDASSRNNFNKISINNTGSQSAIYIDGGTDNTIDCQDGNIIGTNASSTYGIYSTQSNTTIKNCIIRNFINGIYLSGSENNTLSNNTVINNYNHGAYIVSTKYSSIQNGNYNNNRYSGIFLSASSKNNITGVTTNYNNPSNDAGGGMYWYGGITLSTNSDNNTLTNNTIYYNKQSGINVGTSENIIERNNLGEEELGIWLNYGSQSNWLSNNSISNTRRGITLVQTAFNTVANNTVYCTSNSTQSAQAGYIIVGQWDLSSTTNNTIESNTYSCTSGRGIDLDSDVWGDRTGAIISGNIIKNNVINISTTGIYIYSSENNSVINNTINFTSGYGIRSYNGTKTTIVNNTIISSDKAHTLMYIQTTSGNNIIYLNNFTPTSTYYIYDLNGTNYYNSSYDGANQGNIYHNVINSSHKISGTESSTISGLYIGTLGSAYPYNTTTSSGLFTCNFVGCEDYAPLTASNNYPPVIYNVILNATSQLNASSDNLTLYYSEIDYEGDNVSNVTDWRINGTSIAVLNMPFNTNISSGAVKDYSTYENNGTLGNSTIGTQPIWTSAGKVGGAYSFDGTDDFIQLTSITNITKPFTMSAWVKFNNVSGWQTIFGRDTNESIQRGAFYLQKENEVVSMPGEKFAMCLTQITNICVGGNETYPSLGLYSSTEVVDDTWYYITSTYDGANVKLYVNGNLEAQESYTEEVLNQNSPLLIGAGYFNNNTVDIVNGTIDEVMILNRALSPEQINEIYQSGLNNHSVNTIVSNETAFQETWNVAITPSDGYERGTTELSNNLTIGATNPVMLSSRIEPTTTYTNDTLWGYCNASDVDLDNLYYHFRWFKNGVLNNSGTTSSTYTQSIEQNINNLSSTLTTKGETWILSCLADDTALNSSWFNSTGRLISNTPPVKINLSYPVNNDTNFINRTPRMNWTTGADLDSDSLTYRLEVSRYEDFSSTVINQTGLANNYYDVPEELDFDTYYWRVKANDGEDWGTFSDTWNFTLVTYLAITLETTDINFGNNVLPNDVNDTTNDNPSPFSFVSTSNTYADLFDTNATAGLWTSVAMDTENWQIEARSTGSNGIFNESGSKTSWQNVSSHITNLITYFNYSYGKNNVSADIRIQVPQFEPVGAKKGSVLFTWEVSS